MLQKQPITLTFGQGLDQKTDPFQVPIGKFLVLENSVFNKANLLQKRNGFQELTSLPNTSFNYVTTFNGNLSAIGTSLYAYVSASESWVSKGNLYPIRLSAQPILRKSTGQSQCDAAVSSNGLVCTVYTDTSPSTTYNYVITDLVTGQNVVSPTVISTPSEPPRVFVLGNYFIIVFSQSANIKYIWIPVNNVTSPSAATTLVTNYASGGTQLAFDGVVANNNLYIGYNGSDGGGAIRMTYLDAFLTRQTTSTGVNVSNTNSASMMSVCADVSAASPIIWLAWYKTAGTTGKVLAVDGQLNSVLVATSIITTGTILNITSTATSGSITAFYEVSTAYSYDSGIATNIINKRSVTSAGVVGSASTIHRSFGLASKAFLIGTTTYMLAVYSSTYQPTYFMMDSSGNIIGKLAYSNGGGYLTLGLPEVSVLDNVAYVSYLFKDLIDSANKSQSPTSATPVYASLGVNLASFNFNTDEIVSAEIGGNLHISGGMLWAYDGLQIVEQGFHLYPDSVEVTTSTTGGSLSDQTYYYVATYEWADNQGNIHRSAPSLPVKQITAGGNTSTNTINVPTLRATAKSNIQILIYRWSTANQIYYKVSSAANSTTSDSVAFTDTFADASIVGNAILYTTGGVIEDIGPPATDVMTLFKSRMILVDAEDPNLMWYSKQVIEATPVEFSDLFTIYVAPTISAQGNTGPITALSVMDDKLIIFKKNAIYYLTGNGPDNTGANNDFSDPVFVTSTVGCELPRSIVFIPQGLLFQSDKGIWLLGRDLSTSYIGAPVEDFTLSSDALSSIAIPETNQVRFTMDSGAVIMYDYYFQQWGSFVNIPQISACLYQDLHTYIDSFGRVFQENPGSYLDGSSPVLMAFTTSWFALAGLRGYQRAYFMYLLATYYSPHKMVISLAYDYEQSPSQMTVFTPDNFNPAFGEDSDTDPIFGSDSPMGGNSGIEKERIFFDVQRCESIQISIQEQFDSSLGAEAGAGFSLSGINVVVGLKKGYPTQQAARSTG